MYVEDLLALNLLVNTFLLYLTARLGGKNAPLGRLVAGGLAASLYSLTVFLPQAPAAFSWPGKLAASVLIILVTFRPRRLPETMRLCGVFFLASFILAGAIMALHFFGHTTVSVGGGVFYIEPLRPGVLFLGVTVVFLLTVLAWGASARLRKRKNFCYALRIADGGQEVTTTAYVDTGNHLRDPISGKPVAVASYRAVRPFLPAPLKDAFESGEDPVMKLGELKEKEGRFGVVPYRSVEHSGLLLCFKPETVWLQSNGKKILLDGMRFAITAKTLSEDGDVEVLLGPDVLQLLGGDSA